MTARALFFACLIGAAGCAPPLRSSARHVSASLCTVTAEELRSRDALSLFEALTEVRPSVLRTNLHGELPIVVLDGVVTGDAMVTLRSLSATEVFAVRRLSAATATQRYGLNQSNAVLEIVTFRSGIRNSESEDSRC